MIGSILDYCEDSYIQYITQCIHIFVLTPLILTVSFTYITLATTFFKSNFLIYTLLNLWISSVFLLIGFKVGCLYLLSLSSLRSLFNFEHIDLICQPTHSNNTWPHVFLLSLWILFSSFSLQSLRWVAFTNIVSSLHFITPDFSPTYPRSCQLPLSLPLDKATSNFAFSLFIYLIVFLACSSLPDALHKLFSIMLNFNLSCSLELSILSLLLEILFKSHISNYFLNMCL